MSTTVYLQCLSHDPPLQSDEVGQHLCDLKDIRGYIKNRKLLIDVVAADYHLDNGNPNWVMTAAWFFWAHKECEIGIVDECGDEHPVEVPV